jgi:hypothetical protein
LVVDGRKETEVEYWLNYVKSISVDTPIIIVMNKIDENQNYDVNRQKLLDNYLNIKAFHRVSCLEAGDAFLDFVKDMIKIAKEDIEITKNPLPVNWLKVRDELSSLGEPQINYKEYKNTLTINKIEESKHDELSQVYEDLGSIKTIESDDGNTIVLDPRWLTNAMSLIIANNEARFTKNDLSNILPSNYEKQQYQFIIKTMVEFKRCYTLDKNTYIIPDLLSDNPPNNMYNIKNTTEKPLEFRFKPTFITYKTLNKYKSTNNKIPNNHLPNTPK